MIFDKRIIPGGLSVYINKRHRVNIFIVFHNLVAKLLIILSYPEKNVSFSQRFTAFYHCRPAVAVDGLVTVSMVDNHFVSVCFIHVHADNRARSGRKYIDSRRGAEASGFPPPPLS